MAEGGEGNLHVEMETGGWACKNLWLITAIADMCPGEIRVKGSSANAKETSTCTLFINLSTEEEAGQASAHETAHQTAGIDSKLWAPTL